MCELGCPGAGLRSATWVEMCENPGRGGRKPWSKALGPECRERRIHRPSLNSISTFRTSETFRDKMWGEKCTHPSRSPLRVARAARFPEPFRRWSTVHSLRVPSSSSRPTVGQALLPVGCCPHCCRRGTSGVDTCGAPGTGSPHTLSQDRPWGPQVVMGFATRGH